MKGIWTWLSDENNRNVLSFLGTGVAVIIAGCWTYFTYFNQPVNQVQKSEPVTIVQPEKPSVKEQPKHVVEQPRKEATNKALNNASFSGTYVGISTEGVTRLPIKINFTHSGESVSGTYTLSGMLGEMQGKISGNTFIYYWRLGEFYGRGRSFIQGNSIQGTWGYGDSDSNAGTLVAQLQ